MADDVNNHQMGLEEELHQDFDLLLLADLQAELDHEINRFVGEADSNIANTPIPESFGLLTSGPAPTTQEESGEPDTDLPSISVASAMLLSGSTRQMGETERMGEMERFAETEQVEEMWWMEEPIGTEPMLTPGTTLEILGSFPVVATQDLPEGHHDCPICQEAYEDNEDSEVPVRLPCRHIFGKTCISKWLSNNTCPLCRATIYSSSGPYVLVRVGEAREPETPVLQHTDMTQEERSRFHEGIRMYIRSRFREDIRTYIQHAVDARMRQVEVLDPASTQRIVSLRIATLESMLRDLESLDIQRNDG